MDLVNIVENIIYRQCNVCIIYSIEHHKFTKVPNTSFTIYHLQHYLQARTLQFSDSIKTL